MSLPLPAPSIGNEHPDAILVPALLKQVLHAAKVARTFFTDIADKENVTGSLDLRVVQRANDGEQHRKAAGVVADTGRGQSISISPYLYVCAFGKNRIEMRRDGEERAGSCALAQGKDVPFGIDLDIR